MKLKCVNNNIGCDQVVPYENFIQHLKECNFSLFTCNGQGCNFTGNKSEIIPHIKVCEYLHTLCDFCFSDFQKNQIDSHREKCLVKNSLEKNVKIEIEQTEELKDYLTQYEVTMRKYLENTNEKLMGNDQKAIFFEFLAKDAIYRRKIEEMLPEISGYNDYLYRDEPEKFEIFQEKIKPLRSKFAKIVKIGAIASFNDNVIGTNELVDLNTIRKDTGICCAANGDIIIELNNYYHFNEIEIASYKGGNHIAWSYQYGANSLIYVSQDGENWKEVGMLPSDYNTKIVKVKLLTSLSKFIRFTNENPIGISYLNIPPLNMNYFEERPQLFMDYAFPGDLVDYAN